MKTFILVALAAALSCARGAMMDDFHAGQAQMDASIVDVYDGTNLPQSARAMAQAWAGLSARQKYSSGGPPLRLAAVHRKSLVAV